VYYVWETRRRGETQVIVPKFAPVQREYHGNFISGRRFAVELPELELRFHAAGDFELTDDLVIRNRRCLMHSQRLIETLRRAGVDSIDYHACRLVNEATGSVYRTHRAANLLDVIHCLDREQSELEIDDEEPNEIWYIHRLKLLEDRLGDSLMFRLGERRSTVIVHESVKQCIEREGLTGPVFLPADGYREYPGAPTPAHNVIGTHDLDPYGAADAGRDDPDVDDEAPEPGSPSSLGSPGAA
jgi:hypothetical protein